MAADGSKLFGDAAADEKPKEKRTKLKDIDSLAKQALDPWGKSVLGDLSDKKLWDMISKGNGYALHFSNLASSDEYRQGVGISQTAQLLAGLFKHMKEDEDFRTMIAPDVLEKIDSALAGALTFLGKLDAGKGSESSESDTFASLKANRDKSKEANSPEAVDAAAREFFKFLQGEDCERLLRTMEILSGSGELWSGYCALRAATAWLKHQTPTPTADSVATCAKKRQFQVQAEHEPKRAKKSAKDLFK
jgi:hypothetical protein